MISDMSWRRFITLLSNMSQNSVFYYILRTEQDKKPVDNTDDIMRDIQKQMKRK